MSRRPLSLALALLLCGMCPAEEWELYHAPEADAAKLASHVQPLLPEGVTLRSRALVAECSTEQDMQLQIRAIAAGISQLPSLVLRDAKGAYAVIPFSELSAEKLRQAQQLATAPEREDAARRRALVARLFQMRYQFSHTQDAAQQERIISRLTELMQHPDIPEELRQLIGLNCLYPALMQQYTESYQGAHTPRSEARLLEAIRVLETVRDTNPLSYFGRRAYEEREKLRAARLKNRQYE